MPGLFVESISCSNLLYRLKIVTVIQFFNFIAVLFNILSAA